MLFSLRMQNIALIDDVRLDLENGLNILTGETGAGKSILMDGINLALGSRAQKELLRPDGSSRVDLLFVEEDAKILSRLTELGISADQGEILMTRQFSVSPSQQVRSLCRINGQIVTAGQMKDAARLLIDIHGQHEHQSLLDTARHREILDRFDDRIQEAKDMYHQLFETYTALSKALEGYEKDEQDKERLLSLMQYERDEIEQADVRDGEEEELKVRRRKLYNSERMRDAVTEAVTLLKENMSGPTISDMLGQAIASLNGIASLDEALPPVLESLRDTSAVLDDLGYQLSAYLEQLDMDPQELNEIESRLDVIRRVTSKYGATSDKIRAYYEDLLVRIDKLEHIQQTKEQLRARKAAAEGKLRKAADQLHALRYEAAVEVGNEVTEILKTLQFKDPSFVIEVRPTDTYRSYGTDDVEFRIRTNVGDAVKPLHMIASGGEMSRIMLAIKTVLARRDEIPTLIFDEIDTGISGRTAQSVAERMCQIAQYHQVLCVTHLPQIAAMADVHFAIEKTVAEGHTHTEVRSLDRDGMIEELARLTSGVAVTDAVLSNARELKEQAELRKQQIAGEKTL
ncbi:MAG: DNA repair protein RecN [Firmicutes bacterium]|nr:DNA repair protein RecN [Bacillota bacterium]